MEEGELDESMSSSKQKTTRKSEATKRPYSEGSEDELDEHLAIRPPIAIKKHKKSHHKKSKSNKDDKKKKRHRDRSSPPPNESITSRSHHHLDRRKNYESSGAYGDNGQYRRRDYSENDRGASSRDRYSRGKSKNYRNQDRHYASSHSRSKSRNDDYKSKSGRRNDSRPSSPLIKRVDVETYGQNRSAERSSSLSDGTLPKSYSSKRSNDVEPLSRYGKSSDLYKKKLKNKSRHTSEEISSVNSDDNDRKRRQKKHKKIKHHTPSVSSSSAEELEEDEEEEEEVDSEEDSEDEEDEEESSSENSEEESDQNNQNNSSVDENMSSQYLYKKGIKSRFDSSSSEEEEEMNEDELDDEDDEDSSSHINDYNGQYENEEPSPESETQLLPYYYPAKQGTRSVDYFRCLNRIEEGTYGVVYRAEEKSTGRMVALKRLKMEKEKEGFPITSLREVNTLAKANHENIVGVQEIVVGSNVDKIYIVMEYVEHDLKTLMETMKEPFLTGEVKTLMLQLLRGVHHLHENWILHRDLKTSNLLLSHRGILKIGDFGLAREYGSPLRPYTPIVVTLWYRCPELLLGTKEYSTKVDMWSVGCILAELVQKKALLPGKSEVMQLELTYNMLGTPNDEIWPGYSELPHLKKTNLRSKLPAGARNQLRKKFSPTQFDHNGLDLLNSLLTYDPSTRLSAEDALKHIWFKKEPRPIPPKDFPTWPAKSELALRKEAAGPSSATPKAPSGGAGYDALLNEDDYGEGFQLKAPKEGCSKQGTGFFLKF